MQARIDGRRAAPPRPTLLVGDLEACFQAFERLQQRVLEIELKQATVVDIAEGDGRAAAEAWRDLVPRCRALRETLTSLRELSHFTREVYETAADVCMRAGDLPEALKALQTLVQHIYPALAAAEAAAPTATQGPAAALAATSAQEAGELALQPPPGISGPPRRSPPQEQQQQQQTPPSRPPLVRERTTAASSACDEGDDGAAWLCDAAAPPAHSRVEAALQRPSFRRWPEAAGALALYFTAAAPAGAPPGDAQLDTLSTLRRMPAPLLASPEVQAALRLRGALADGNFVAAFRLRSQAPPLVRGLLCGAAAASTRERALSVLAATYRTIAVAAVCRMLALDAQSLLLACLKQLADRGHAAAGRALSGLQQEEAAALGAANLMFKG